MPPASLQGYLQSQPADSSLWWNLQPNSSGQHHPVAQCNFWTQQPRSFPNSHSTQSCIETQFLMQDKNLTSPQAYHQQLWLQSRCLRRNTVVIFSSGKIDTAMRATLRSTFQKETKHGDTIWNAKKTHQWEKKQHWTLGKNHWRLLKHISLYHIQAMHIQEMQQLLHPRPLVLGGSSPPTSTQVWRLHDKIG